MVFSGLRVRAGVHKGNPKRVKDEVSGRFDYFGPAVNRAARVSNSGAGGQTIISTDAWNEVKTSLESMVGTPSHRDVGTHTFKGLDTPELCIELLPRGLEGRRDHFPELNTTRVPVTLKDEVSSQIYQLEERIKGVSAVVKATATPPSPEHSSDEASDSKGRSGDGPGSLDHDQSMKSLTHVTSHPSIAASMALKTCVRGWRTAESRTSSSSSRRRAPQRWLLRCLESTTR